MIRSVTSYMLHESCFVKTAVQNIPRCQNGGRQKDCGAFLWRYLSVFVVWIRGKSIFLCERGLTSSSKKFLLQDINSTSSETQGQIKGARESLNGRKNIYGTKKSKEWREKPLGTMSYQTSSKRSPPFWLLIGARKLVFFWHQSEARTAATVWNGSGKTSSPGALLAVLYFSSCHIFPPV